MIITLGEGILGTVASINAVVHGSAGWTVDAAVVAFAGIGLIFATWWTYFAIPWAEVLDLHRERSFIWGYGHIVIFGSLAAIGGGLHVAAYYLEHETTLGVTGTVLSTAIPVTIYVVALYGIYACLHPPPRPVPPLLLAGTRPCSCSRSARGRRRRRRACLVVLMFAPIVTVVGYETLGHRVEEARLARMRPVVGPPRKAA